MCFPDDCGWCKSQIPFGAPEILTTPEGLKYCTESCFTQSRRASYKRAKTCEWCKHIRHAVSYVNFHDGATQLQFCSEKCLNQYKMQVFCKEIQAQLDLNPDLRGKGRSTEDDLITPDMWMKNCRSRSMSPDERSSESDATSHASEHHAPLPVPRASAAKAATSFDPMASDAARVDGVVRRGQRCALKENEATANLMPYTHQQRLQRKRRLQRHSMHSTGRDNVLKVACIDDGEADKFNDMAQAPAHRAPRTPTMDDNAPQHRNKMAPIRLANIQNLSLQAASPNGMHNDAAPPNNAVHQSPCFGDDRHPRRAFAHSSSAIVNGRRTKPPPALPTPTLGSAATSGSDSWAWPPLKQPAMPLNDLLASIFNFRLPSTTVLVPYPIVMPFPLPIPVPLPYEAFLRAAESRRTPNACQRSDSGASDTDATNCKDSHIVDEPLDFSKQSTDHDDNGDAIE